MEEIIQLLNHIPAGDLIKFILALVSVIIAINTGIIKGVSWLEKWRKTRNAQEDDKADLCELINDTKEIKENMNLVCKSLKIVLADSLNRKCKRYWQKGYIPADELDEFIKEHESYNELHGNSTIDAKFEQIMDNLQPHSDNVLSTLIKADKE